NRLRLQYTHQMGGELNISGPGSNRPVISPHRHAMNTRIGDGNRLNMDDMSRNMRDCCRSGTKQGRLDLEQSVTIRRGPFRKQDHDLPTLHPLGNLGDLVTSLAPFLPGHKDGFLELCEEAKDRPIRHFVLGDEGNIGNSTQHEDVLPGGMIGRNHQRPPRVKPAMDIDPYSKQPAGSTMPVSGKIAPELQIECKADKLKRQQNKRERRQGGDHEANPQPDDQASSLSSRMP